MDTQVIVLRKIWKYSLISIAVATIALAALFVTMRSASACGSEGNGYHQENNCGGNHDNGDSCSSCVGGSVNTNINTNENKQIQKQENNQEVKVEIENKTVVKENNEAGEVKSASVPVKQPETGAGAVGLLSMFSAGPAGMYLARFRRK